MFGGGGGEACGMLGQRMGTRRGSGGLTTRPGMASCTWLPFLYVRDAISGRVVGFPDL